MLSFYKQLSAEVYDIDKPIGHSFGDVEYYSERLNGCKGKILEPAVGTGRILIPLIQAGFDVEGMDLSDEMLSLCRSNCHTAGLSPKLYEKNMIEFSLPHKYDAIIIPTGSFLLLEKREDSIRALKCFYKHLSHGGRLIMDLFMPDHFNIGTNRIKSWENTHGDFITMHDSLVTVDFINQYTLSHIKYEKWRNRQLIQTELETFPLRWYGVEEFVLILENIGFKDIVISSDYHYGQYPTDKNQIITFEASKK